MLIASTFVVAANLAAATPSHPKPKAPSRTVVLSLVEDGGKSPRSQVKISLPVGGELEAWVQGGQERRYCRASVDRVGTAGELRIELGCGPSHKSSPNLRLRAQRPLPLGHQVVLGQVLRADGRTLEVRATLK